MKIDNCRIIALKSSGNGISATISVSIDYLLADNLVLLENQLLLLMVPEKSAKLLGALEKRGAI